MKRSASASQADETVEAITVQRQQLEEELRSETATIQTQTDPLTEKLETVSVRRRRSISRSA